jgi:Ca2+-binding EF-hand superfamily protein
MIEGFRVFYQKGGDIRTQDFPTMLKAMGFALPLVIAEEYTVTSIIPLYVNLGQG